MFLDDRNQTCTACCQNIIGVNCTNVLVMYFFVFTCGLQYLHVFSVIETIIIAECHIQRVSQNSDSYYFGPNTWK